MNKDFETKIRMNNVLWDLQCYTRIEVKLSEYGSEKRLPYELTDLDVLGVRILPDLSFDYIVADCTSNRNTVRSPIQRVFWLRGVMDFFGAEHGYLTLITNENVLETSRTVGQRLSVTMLNESNLILLEKRVIDPDSAKLTQAKPEAWMYLESNLTNLAGNLDPILTYRKHTYWVTSQNQNLHGLISTVSKCRRSLDEKNPLHRALVLDTMALFAISVLNMSQYVLRTNPERPEQELKSYLYGGYTELRRREGIADNIKKLVESMPVQQNLFSDVVKLEPDYLPSLFDLAFRFLNRPADSAQLPRYLELIMFEKALYKSANKDGLKYVDWRFSEITKKLSRDLGVFFREVTGISEAMVADLF